MDVRKLQPLLFFTLLAAGCSGLDKDTAGGTGFGSSTVNGFIFKGPLALGSALTLTPLTDAGEPDGDPVEVVVGADDGAYSAELDHRGLVLATATGLAFDEARGEAGPVEITLHAYAVLDDDAQELHINVLTSLARQRVEVLLAEGIPPEEAIAQAEGELAAALPIGGGTGPGAGGAELNPYGDGYAQSWLFAVSSVLAQTGRDLEEVGEGTLGDLMVQLREDLADDGAISEALRAAILLGEEHLDPDLATLGLASVIAEAGVDRALPDLHPVLDSDHDGLVNSDDNCRYVVNPDQSDGLGLGFGDACDYRLASVSTDDQWGCGVLQRDGSVVCWQVDGEPTGGTPPAADVYPAHATFPWESGERLDGTYTEVAVASGVVCALSVDGSIDCSVEGAPTELVLGGLYRQIAVSSTVICALDGEGALTCYDTTGATLVEDAGPHARVEIFGDTGVCVLSEDGGLSWVDHPEEREDLPSLPSGTYDTVDATEGGFGCAISTYDGSLACFGGAELTDGAPAGSFAEVAVGGGVACASDSAGRYTCWRDEGLCPAVEEGPGALWDMTAGGCQVCGVDEAGIGHCWPRLWSQEHL